MTRIRILGIVGLLLLLSGCGNLMGSSSATDPVGIGPGRDEYKKSPCACTTLPQLPPDAGLYRRLGMPS